MARLRLILACIMMLALPLQGFAAASMVLCGGGSNHQHQRAGGGPAEDVSAAHAHHGHGADAAKKVAQSDKSAPDFAHKCSICASCCSAVALASHDTAIAFPLIRQADVSELMTELKSQPALVPDKPPRA